MILNIIRRLNSVDSTRIPAGSDILFRFGDGEFRRVVHMPPIRNLTVVSNANP